MELQSLKVHTIVTDLDGTLLTKEGNISELNQKVLQKAIDEGIEVVLATGRRFYSTYKLASSFRGTLPLICNNGQILRIYPSREKIWQKYLPPELVLQILMIGKKNNFTFLMHTDREEEKIDFITEKPTHSIHKDYSGGIDRSFWHENIESADLLYNVTVLCFFNASIDVLHEFGSLIIERYPDKGIRTVITTIHKIGPCLEVIHADSSKWVGVEEILRRKDKTFEGVISFGDEANDYEMIKESGIGVALSNSIPSLKEIANHVSKYSHSEDGVGKTLLDLGIVRI
ncbi:MAG: HAD family hydrolase [Spirochaetia bacterium]|nr:HAD family hydrolase [Spirochaetia bacterium]